MSHLRYKLNDYSSIAGYSIRGSLLTLTLAIFITLMGVSVLTASAQPNESDSSEAITDSISATISHINEFNEEAAPPYPLTETFDSADGFTQTSDNVYIEGGKVHWNVQGDGLQYVYRDIPAFSGDFRVTVRGQIDGGNYNCGNAIGISDGVGGGAGLSFELTGGGCPTFGPFIGTVGARLDHRYRSCEPEGVFLWVQAGESYTATLTYTQPMANLSVEGVGNQPATPLYEGVVDTLYVGRTGNSGMRRCIGSFDTMIVEPLDALIAPTDLVATATYSTQIDLSWREHSEVENEIRVERWEDSADWQEIASLPADSATYSDNRVMCGATYRYRAAAYGDDGVTFSGYSPVAEVTTAECVVVFEEGWESGISEDVWEIYGSPQPVLRPGEGLNGSTAMDPNGDGWHGSGAISKEAFEIASGINVESWIRTDSPIAQEYSGIEIELSTCSDNDNYEQDCGAYNSVARAISYAEQDVIIYQVLLRHQYREPFAPLNDTWQRHNIRIRPDGYVEFYRNGELKFIDPDPIDLSAFGPLVLDIRGRSVNSYNHIDNIKVTVPEKLPWYMHVVDQLSKPIEGAVVYVDGQPLGESNQAGMINSQPLALGTPLVAVAELEEMPTTRAVHDGWAYRTYLTSLDWEGDEPQPYLVQGPGEQRLVLNPARPLVLFNLLVSIEWDATDEYLDQITRAMQHASDYLLDVSDGQMAFGHVSIYENAEHWTDADIQISTKNIVRPHAHLGGITDADTSHVIRLGRAWDGNSGAEGPWDAPDGYRTIVHEFGHYALRLYDEYFVYTYAGSMLTGALPAHCTGPEIRTGDDATHASIMYYQYNASELSDRFLPALWSPLCPQTAQWQLQRESAWQTLARVFADDAEPPRWQITTPADRGEVMAGPSALPSSLPTWPEVEVHAAPSNAQPRQLLVLDPGDQPHQGAIVALYKNDGRVIGQGFSNEEGRIEVIGGEEDDKVRASSIDGGLAGRAVIGQPDEPITLTLDHVGALAAQSVTDRPYMQIIAEPGPDPEHIDLMVFLHNYSPINEPLVSLTLPGEQSRYTPNLSYSPGSGVYEARIEMAANNLGTGGIDAKGIVQNNVVRQQSTFRLQRSSNHERHDIYSDDGNFDFHLDAGSLPGGETYLVVMPPGALPGPAPRGYAVVGDAYNITASGAVATLEKPGVLKLYYDDATLKPGIEVERLEIRRWDPIDAVWKVVPTSLDAEQKVLSAAVKALGTYTLMVREQTQVYLPAIVR